MKKALAIVAVTATLSGCSNMSEVDKNKIGGVLFGAGAVAICAQSGICAFPI